MIVPFHVLAGILALVFGYTALFAAKGGRLHRKSGLWFVAAPIDARMMRAGGIQGSRRIARPIPVLTPVVLMLYWLWRMRTRKMRGLVTTAQLDQPLEVMS